LETHEEVPRGNSLKYEDKNMSRQSESEDGMDEPTSAIMDVTKKAGDAVKDTARTYLSRFGANIDLEEIERSIRKKPFRSVAIATGVGFVIGGGMVTRPAVALLSFFGWIAAKDAATRLMTGMVRARTN
jgi:ElaB/YqjD/DUF883 family membrane-anchored ribosome-binding protein